MGASRTPRRCGPTIAPAVRSYRRKEQRALVDLVAGEVGGEAVGGELGVDLGVGEDGADARFVIEADLHGAEELRFRIDVEEDPFDFVAHVAVAGASGELVDAVGDSGFDEVEGFLEAFEVAIESAVGEEGEGLGAGGAGVDLAGALFIDVDEGHGGAIGDGEGFGGLAEFPAHLAGALHAEGAGGGDRFAQGGKGAFLNEVGLERGDAALFGEPSFERCGVELGRGNAGEGEEAGEETHDLSPRGMGDLPRRNLERILNFNRR